MILHRVIKHFRQQEWTAIAIDFVIVVIGVFVGIQVSNWNQDRVTEKQAAIFTAHLRDDLREEAWGYQVLVSYSRQVLANAQRAVDGFDGTVPMADEDLLVSAYRATQYKNKLRRRPTYDELISTGTIGLIRDAELRDTAMRVYNSPTIEVTVREGMLSRYREAFRMGVPNQVQRALAKNCGDRPARIGDYKVLDDILDYPCQTGLSQAQIDQAVTALRDNPAIVPSLRLRIADLETRLTDLTVNNMDLSQALKTAVTDTP